MPQIRVRDANTSVINFLVVGRMGLIMSSHSDAFDFHQNAFGKPLHSDGRTSGESTFEIFTMLAVVRPASARTFLMFSNT